MNHRWVWIRNATVWTGLIALLGSGGCSLLYDFNTSQCNETKDCLSQGPQFALAVCKDHVCVQTAGDGTGGVAAIGGNGNVGGTLAVGGAFASGGASSFGGASSGIGGISPTGGTSTAGGTANSGGAQSTGGSQPVGGMSNGGDTSAICKTNLDCIAKHVDQPYICKSGNCVLLTNVNCPVVIPAGTVQQLLNDTTKSPIIVGGFANLTDAINPHNTQAVVNWDLAFDEFNTRTAPGLPSYPAGGSYRPYVGVVCQGYDNAAGGTKNISATISHLVDEIGVTSILASMPAADLLTAWNLTASNVLFMNTGSADLKLVSTSNGGMLWHMLGDPHMMAAAIASQFHQMEPYIYKQRKANFLSTGADNPDSVPLRVIIVYSSYSSMLDVHDVLVSNASDYPESHLVFNGKTWLENSISGDARDVQVTSGASANDNTVMNAATLIEQNPPHVILGLGTDELPYVIWPVETSWGAGKMQNLIRPYYVLSHLLYNNMTTLPAVVSNCQHETPPLHMRMAGVNYAQAQDSRSYINYQNYLNRLVSANPNSGLTLKGTENHYDGAYYLLYSIAAAAAHRGGTPAAAEVLIGLESRVIDTIDGTSVDVDPGQIQDVIIKKFFGTDPFFMALWGTMGYPNFDKLLGTRVSQTSVWCYQMDPSGASWSYQTDGLFYDPQTQQFSPNPNGVPACLQNYCPTNADAGVSTCPENY